MGCNTSACTFMNAPAHFILVCSSQAVTHTIKFVTSDFLHRWSIIYCSTPLCTFPHRHFAHTNTCTTWGLVFDTWLTLLEEPNEGLLRSMTSDSAVSDADMGIEGGKVEVRYLRQEALQCMKRAVCWSSGCVSEVWIYECWSPSCFSLGLYVVWLTGLHRNLGGANLDDPRLSELYDLSKAAREMHSQLTLSLQQAQIEHKYGSLKESMRRSRFFIHHVPTFWHQCTVDDLVLYYSPLPPIMSSPPDTHPSLIFDRAALHADTL